MLSPSKTCSVRDRIRAIDLPDRSTDLELHTTHDSLRVLYVNQVEEAAEGAAVTEIPMPTPPVFLQIILP